MAETQAGLLSYLHVGGCNARAVFRSVANSIEFFCVSHRGGSIDSFGFIGRGIMRTIMGFIRDIKELYHAWREGGM